VEAVRTPPNVGAAIREAAAALRRCGVEANPDAALLVAHALERDRAWLLGHRDDAVDPCAQSRIDALVARRARGEPFAYVVGEAWFYGRRFVVTPDVLVPRPETELVVEAAVDDLRARIAGGARQLRVCDIGTGSGAIAATLAAELPELEVVASDASEAALLVAAQNARRLGLGARIRFAHGDLAEPLRMLGPFDCIVANLPYVPSAEVPARPDPVGYEPLVALDGGLDGLGLYRRLLRQLPTLVAPRASAFFEAAPGAIEPLARLVIDEVPEAHVEIGEDYAGLERWVAISLP
jgi:release factor glutamine methyltransferase